MKTIEQMAEAIKERTLEYDNDAIEGLTLADANRCAKSALTAIREPDPNAVARAADRLDITPTLAYAVWVTMVDYMLEEK